MFLDKLGFAPHRERISKQNTIKLKFFIASREKKKSIKCSTKLCSIKSIRKSIWCIYYFYLLSDFYSTRFFYCTIISFMSALPLIQILCLFLFPSRQEDNFGNDCKLIESQRRTVKYLFLLKMCILDNTEWKIHTGWSRQQIAQRGAQRKVCMENFDTSTLALLSVCYRFPRAFSVSTGFHSHF